MVVHQEPGASTCDGGNGGGRVGTGAETRGSRVTQERAKAWLLAEPPSAKQNQRSTHQTVPVLPDQHVWKIPGEKGVESHVARGQIIHVPERAPQHARLWQSHEVLVQARRQRQELGGRGARRERRRWAKRHNAATHSIGQQAFVSSMTAAGPKQTWQTAIRAGRGSHAHKRRRTPTRTHAPSFPNGNTTNISHPHT